MGQYISPHLKNFLDFKFWGSVCLHVRSALGFLNYWIGVSVKDSFLSNGFSNPFADFEKSLTDKFPPISAS